jgi:hypothetical protein
MSGTLKDPIVIRDDSPSPEPALAVVRHDPVIDMTNNQRLRWNSALMGGVPVMNQPRWISHPRPAPPPAPEPNHYRFHITLELVATEEQLRYLIYLLCFAASLAGFFYRDL